MMIDRLGQIRMMISAWLYKAWPWEAGVLGVLQHPPEKIRGCAAPPGESGDAGGVAAPPEKKNQGVRRICMLYVIFCVQNPHFRVRSFKNARSRW